MVFSFETFFISIAILILINIILDYVRFCRSARFIAKEIKSLQEKSPVKSRSDPKIHILIPVLNETSVIQQNVSLFANLDGVYTLHYITTERESVIKNGANETKNELGRLRDKGFVFNIIHYPYTHGAMAHQLNFAVDELTEHGIIKNHDYVLVYNADSKVHQSIIEDLYLYLELKNYPEVVHQPALFLDNYSSFKGWTSPILKNIALLQSRWTIVCEITRILTSGSSRRSTRFFESGHLVGHGMLLRIDTLKEIGGFFTQYKNEDLPMGYVLGNLGKKINIFPYLENGESPRTLLQVIRQYTTWYFGASGYIKYARDYFKKTNRFQMRALVTALRNQIRALVWLLSGIFWFLVISVPLIMGYPNFSILFICLFITQHLLQYYFLKIFIIPYQKSNFNTQDQYYIGVMQIILSPVAFIFHTFGPIRASVRMLISIVSNNEIVKEKTER